MLGAHCTTLTAPTHVIQVQHLSDGVFIPYSFVAHLAGILLLLASMHFEIISATVLKVRLGFAGAKVSFGSQSQTHLIFDKSLEHMGRCTQNALVQR